MGTGTLEPLNLRMHDAETRVELFTIVTLGSNTHTDVIL